MGAAGPDGSDCGRVSRGAADVALTVVRRNADRKHRAGAHVVAAGGSSDAEPALSTSVFSLRPCFLETAWRRNRSPFSFGCLRCAGYHRDLFSRAEFLPATNRCGCGAAVLPDPGIVSIFPRRQSLHLAGADLDSLGVDAVARAPVRSAWRLDSVRRRRLRGPGLPYAVCVPHGLASVGWRRVETIAALAGPAALLSGDRGGVCVVVAVGRVLPAQLRAPIPDRAGATSGREVERSVCGHLCRVLDLLSTHSVFHLASLTGCGSGDTLPAGQTPVHVFDVTDSPAADRDLALYARDSSTSRPITTEPESFLSLV